MGNEAKVVCAVTRVIDKEANRESIDSIHLREKCIFWKPILLKGKNI